MNTPKLQPLDLLGAHKRFREQLFATNKPKCEMCTYFGHERSASDIKLEASRTAYPWDGKGEDPNRSTWLCRECASEHHAHWDDMWRQANDGRL